jgi:hypothetical protein
MKKKPFTWQHLAMIWNSLGVKPEEVQQILEREILDKNWIGTETKIGRMWNDQKKNRLSFGKAVMRLYEDRLTADRKKSKTFWFVAVSKIKTSGMTSKTFLKKVDIWKKLPFVKLPKKELSESYKKRQTQIRNNISKIEATNKKIAEMRRKRDSIIAARRR